MKKSFVFKLTEYIITFICVITLNFFIPRLMPGDPFTFISSDENDVTVTYTDDQINKYKEYYGLDDPIHIQYINYIKNTFKGNFGYSIYYNDDVTNIIKERIRWTISLVIISLVISSAFGTLLGSISAWNRNKITDQVLYFISIFFSEIPSFLIGLLFLFIFAAKLKWFPLSGGISNFANYNSEFSKLLDIVHHAVLPVLTLSFVGTGGFYVLSRNSMISVLSKDYMKTAKAKGLSKKRRIFRHALRNSILPIVTRFFFSLGTMIGGAILVENVFNYPGVGRLMREAVFLRDYPLIQGIFILVTLLVLTMNLFADILYKKLDPRVK